MRRHDAAPEGRSAREAGRQSRRRGWALWLLAALAVVASGSSARAQFLVRQVNLAGLAERAEIIVQGRVIEARYEGHPDYPHVPTALVTLEVERVLRGPAGKRFGFRQFLPPGEAMRGKRGYVVGQRLLLFLPEPSRYGLSSPIGREQGLFRISRDAQGNELVENGYGNAGLFKNVEEDAARAGLTLSAEQLRLAGVKRGPVRLEEFVSLVKEFTSLSRFR